MRSILENFFKLYSRNGSYSWTRKETLLLACSLVAAAVAVGLLSLIVSLVVS